MATPKVSFLLRYDKINEDTGERRLYCRITVDGKRSDFSINRWVHPDRWVETDMLRKARKKEDQELHFYMESIRSRIKGIERELLDNRIPMTSENIKKAYSGKANKSKTLMEAIKWHNSQFQKTVDAEMATKATLKRYETVKKHVLSFLKFQFKKDDIPLEELEEDFITNLELYLRSERKDVRGSLKKCANNSAVKYIRNFRKIIKMVVKAKWLKHDPFTGYDGKVRESSRPFLTPDEIELIRNKQIDVLRLEVIRDIFCFSIFTGYAYSDVKKLTYNDIHRHIDGELWIFTDRQKTKVEENVLLLDPAIQLIEKYRSHPVCLKKGVLFPVPSNQRVNTYLKELADICGIQKKLTFHTARHSFATSIMLANNIPMETLMTAIGHTRIKQTQHYAKMLNAKVSSDMKRLKEIFRPKPDDNSDVSATG